MFTFDKRINKFLIAGLSAALVNLLFMVLFVEAFGFTSSFLRNLANVLSIEISIVYHFLISRLWTWSDAPRRKGKTLFSQLVSFHMVNLTGMFIRIVAFAAFDRMGIYYILNVSIGIVLVAVFSYFFYDRFVFSRTKS